MKIIFHCLLVSITVAEKSIIMPRSWFLIPYSKKEPELLGEMAGSKTRQEIYKMILEYLVVPESRWENKTNQKHGGCGVWGTKIYL